MMRINFRQGILSTPPTFLTINGSQVSITIPPAPTNPLIITIADGDTNYTIHEPVSVANAWAGPFNGSGVYWLYWDVDVRTGAKSYGHTTIEPKAQAVAPASPQDGAHWYNTSTNMQYVWNSTRNRWVRVFRVFAAKLQGNVLISVSDQSPNFTGTQVGNNSISESGEIVFDINGDVITRGNGTFFTTETIVKTGIVTNTAVKLASIVTEAEAQEPIDAYSAVVYTAQGKIIPATANDTTRLVALVENFTDTGEYATVIVRGNVINPAWDWSNLTPGTPLYIDVATAQLTATPPIAVKVPVARVVSGNTVIFEPALPGGDVTIADLETRVAKSGDTMTGFLTLNADPANELHAATKAYVDAVASGGVENQIIKFQATNTSSVTILAGSPVSITTGGVQLAINDGADSRAKIAGIALTDVAPGALGEYRINGKIDLTTTQWAAVTNDVSGLVPGREYFVARGEALKPLTETPPTGYGMYSVKALRAITTTTAQLLLPAVVVQI